MLGSVFLLAKLSGTPSGTFARKLAFWNKLANSLIARLTSLKAFICKAFSDFFGNLRQPTKTYENI